MNMNVNDLLTAVLAYLKTHAGCDPQTDQDWLELQNLYDANRLLRAAGCEPVPGKPGQWHKPTAGAGGR
jgi:hypothetical protein